MFIVLHFIIVFYSILDSSGFGDKNTIIIENIMHYWKWCSFNIKNARQLIMGLYIHILLDVSVKECSAVRITILKKNV